MKGMSYNGRKFFGLGGSFPSSSADRPASLGGRMLDRKTFLTAPVAVLTLIASPLNTSTTTHVKSFSLSVNCGAFDWKSFHKRRRLSLAWRSATRSLSAPLIRSLYTVSEFQMERHVEIEMIERSLTSAIGDWCRSEHQTISSMAGQVNTFTPADFYLKPINLVI